jgi:hypothetical protein
MQKLLERTTKSGGMNLQHRERESVKTGDYDLKLKIPDKDN